MKIYNTMTRTKEEFTPLTPGEVRMYVCGVTPYDYSHVGHARSAVVFDVIRRWLEYRGFRVTMVRNYTDIDDKIIKRANQEGASATEVSQRFIDEETRDMRALGVAPPTVAPRATEHVAGMIALIGRLVAKGVAYVVDGDVCFEIRRFPPYGKLSGKNLDELLAGARVEVDERKRDPRDFALWKAAKPGEPSWESPWGPGRPGWHIECSVMAIRYLGEIFDIHGGGTDLIFPHHECEIAQAEADTGKPFARYWLHNGMVNFGAEKMSKSLGNTLRIREMVKRHDPDALRLWMLGTRYRDAIEWSEERVRDAKSARDRLRSVVGEGEALAHSPARVFGWLAVKRVDRRVVDGLLARVGARELGQGVRECVARFEEAMDDDFNTPRARDVLFQLGNLLHKSRPKSDAAEPEREAFVSGVETLLALARVLGLLEPKADTRLQPGGGTLEIAAGDTIAVAVTEAAHPALSAELRSRIEVLISERDKARKTRDWKRADELRRELHELGASVEDTPAGTQWAWKPRER